MKPITTKDNFQTIINNGVHVSLTEGMQALIDRAIEVLEPHVNEVPSYWTAYYLVKGEQVSSEHDTCDLEKCMKKSKAAIRKSYGKYTRVKHIFHLNNGDHDHIERCCICGVPLNEFMTWVLSEVEHWQGTTDRWNEEFFKQNAFDLNVLLNSLPSIDHDISSWARMESERIKPIIKSRRKMYNFITSLCLSITLNL